MILALAGTVVAASPAAAAGPAGELGNGERPSQPVALWGLETYPGVSESGALRDQQPALGGDTPLTAAGVTFADGQRFVAGKEATFAGAGTLSTTTTVVDTTKSFAVATWVRVDRTDTAQDLITQDGFALEYRNKSFCLVIRQADGAAPVSTCTPRSVVAGRWVHVAADFDAAAPGASENRMRIWTGGVLRTEAAGPVTPSASTGPMWLGGPSNYLLGALADVAVFDRALTQEDLTGDKPDPTSGVEGERGLLDPIEVGDWDFSAATDCYDPANPRACAAPDATSFDRRLHFTQGVTVEQGSSSYGQFDNVFPDDPTITTREYALSQTGGPQWVDGPVLRTDNSFTVTAKLRFDSLPGVMTAVSARGTTQSAFSLGVRTVAVDGVCAPRFDLRIPATDGHRTKVIDVPAPEGLTAVDAGVWHDVTAVYDVGAQTARLYVDGVLKQSASHVGTWNAAGPLVVGGSVTGTAPEQWFGGIDEVRVFQGAMTGARVAALVA